MNKITKLLILCASLNWHLFSARAQSFLSFKPHNTGSDINAIIVNNAHEIVYMPTYYSALDRLNLFVANGYIKKESLLQYMDSVSKFWAISISNTQDSGLLISGVIYHPLDTLGDPFILKLDMCGDPQYFKVFHLPNAPEYAINAWEMNGKTWVLFRYLSGDYATLANLDNSGIILKSITYNESYGNCIPFDNCFYCYGGGYFEYKNSSTEYLKPIIIKFDDTLNILEKWIYGLQDTNYFARVGGIAFRKLKPNVLLREMTNSEFYWKTKIMVGLTNPQSFAAFTNLTKLPDIGTQIISLHDTGFLVSMENYYDTNNLDFSHISVIKSDTMGKYTRKILVNFSTPDVALNTMVPFDDTSVILVGYSMNTASMTQVAYIGKYHSKNLGFCNYANSSVSIPSCISKQSRFINLPKPEIINLNKKDFTLYSKSIITATFSNLPFLYPNPAQDFIVIAGLPKQDFPIETEIYNIFGERILNCLLQSTLIDISTLPSGIYYLVVNRTALKFIKSAK